MDKIYIEGELPKCCLMCTLECPEEQRCVDGFTRDCENCEVSDRPKTCPLKPLSVRLAEERKKVVQEIRKRAKKTQFYIEPTEKSPTGKRKGFIYEVGDILLDQIERGGYE